MNLRKEIIYLILSNILAPLPLPASIDETLASYIEAQTIDQRLSDMLHDLHKGRITNFILWDVINAGANPKALVKQIVDGCNLDK